MERQFGEFDLSKDAVTVLQEDLSRASQPHAARQAHQQLDAGRLFDPLDVTSEGGPRNMKISGSLRNAAYLSDVSEVLDAL
jgi:hypothetical protein